MMAITYRLSGPGVGNADYRLAERLLYGCQRSDDMSLLLRREFLRLAAAAAALPTVSQIAKAQTYPSRPVRVITGFAAGGPGDLLMRLVGQWFSEHLGQPFIIENRLGAGGNIAAEVVVRAPPDGYTLLQVGPSNTINATLNDKPNFNFIRDIAPVASIVRVPAVMEVHPSVPAETVSEFIAYAKTNPGKLNMASAGNGSASHVSGELFKMMAGVNMVHVPYRGAPLALADLLGGRVQVMFDSIPNSIEHIRTGKIRPLAVTTAERSAALPNTPTVGELVPGYEASSVYGLGAPKNIPAEIVGRLNREVDAALADPKIQARLAEFGGTVLATAPADFGRLLADEIEKWAKVIRFAEIKAG
jgi:tripartite-type tricarboxylate transporter receptor subunit TctC